MRDVKGYEGLYAVTSCGKVWSYKSDRFLSPCKTKSGYMFVRLCKNGKVKKMYFFVDLSFQQGYKFICLKGQTARPNGRMVMQRTANP